MGDYRDVHSTSKTIESYMLAFNEMVKLCPRVEPGCNSYNQRTVLPTEWTPSFGLDNEGLLPHITRVTVNYERLTDLFSPKVVMPTHTIWKENWFHFQWHIDFPFEIYDWNVARQELINDDEDNPQYKTTPECMKAWDKQSITLSSNLWYYKAWGLKDWKKQYENILSFLDNSPKVVDKYRQEVIKANAEVLKWEEQMANMTTAVKIPV